MTKKYIYIIFFTFFLIITLNIKKEDSIYTFSEQQNDYDFNNYVLKFNDCKLNTNNFINTFSYFNNKNYKILSITPYVDDIYNYLFINKKFNYYDNNLERIINNFKGEYLNTISNDEYIDKICIKEVKINTAYIYIREFKNKSFFLQ